MDVDGVDRLRDLYPFVDQTKTPLPSCWSAKEKLQYLSLTQNNLRVHYKGQGKTHKDAAAIRSDHRIPAACGLYYFEVRIVSKGRDGFMGIGLSQQAVSLNRLPGWDRFSYGYHGDDGNSFCSSGSGVPYGPTFTTDDVIGCGVNLVDSTCFYTKNGHNLGVAFTDLPSGLYPMVGLQTPGEILEANFGHTSFVYDIMEEIREIQLRLKCSVERFLLAPTKSEWFVRLISGYLVHHGFCATAEAFCATGGEQAKEDVVCIKHRQTICKLVKSGRISEAIRQVQVLFPNLFEQNPELFFLLKCRQFIEIRAGYDNDACRISPKCSRAASPSSTSSQLKIWSQLPSKIRPSPLHSPRDSPRGSPRRIRSPRSRNCTPEINTTNDRGLSRSSSQTQGSCVESVENGTAVDNGDCENGVHNPGNPTVPAPMIIDDASVEPADGCDNASEESPLSQSATNGAGLANEKEISVDDTLLSFGLELKQLHEQLQGRNVLSLKSTRTMHDAFALMAYTDPWDSPLASQLQPTQREPIAATLNSAILEMQGHPTRPALEIILSHAFRLREEMANEGLGAAAFADPNFYLSSLSPGHTASPSNSY